jgi:bifunctional DNA-binding transcriptional regulator/antitoxin component of YhaV-PrlF toxin-antitoxin module
MAGIRVNAKGQVTIPGPLRSKYGFPPGTHVVWIEREGELIPQPVAPLATLRGRLKAGADQRSLTEALRAARREDRAREDG